STFSHPLLPKTDSPERRCRSGAAGIPFAIRAGGGYDESGVGDSPRYIRRKGPPVSAPESAALPEGSKAKLSVIKGLRVGKNYALRDGVTYVGRKGPQPVDVDLTEQENPGVEVKLNRFALIWCDKNGLGVADTGRRVTVLNGTLLPSGKRFPLKAD